MIDSPHLDNQRKRSGFSDRVGGHGPALGEELEPHSDIFAFVSGGVCVLVFILFGGGEETGFCLSQAGPTLTV